MRKTKEQLEEIKKRYGVSVLWSWSKINCYKNSPYEYLLKYIERVPEDKQTFMYPQMGGAAHETLERFYENKIPYEKMIGKFEDDLFTLGLAELKFDRSSEEKNEAIQKKYIYDLRHFFANHKPIKFRTAIEKFIIINIQGNILQGYIDCVYKDGDGNYNIIDFKTSTAYSGKKAKENSGQLLLYALGLNQMGVSLDKIKGAFNFLKYQNITIEQLNGKKSTRQIERCKIEQELKANATIWLKKLGYSEQLDYYIQLLLEKNSVECLPIDVQEKYLFDDCYVYIPINQEVIDELIANISETISEIENKEKLYAETGNDKIFYDGEEGVKERSYYFANLCSYSANLHKPYQLYLSKLSEQKNGNVFYGVGIGVDEDCIMTNNDNNLSWLDEI